MATENKKLGYKYGGFKRTKWENKKPSQVTQILRKQFDNLGYKIPNYLKGNKVNYKDFEKATERITKGYENKIQKEKNYTQKKVPIDKKNIKSKLNLTINKLNKTIDKTINKLKDKGYTDQQIKFLQGEPIYSTKRKKPYFKDENILEKLQVKDLKFQDVNAMKDFIKQTEKQIKELEPKKFIKEIENGTKANEFFNSMLEDEYLDELEDFQLENLRKKWDELSGIEKEIAIKNALEELRERYKNKYERDWTDETGLNAYHTLMQYLTGATSTLDLPF